MVCLFCWYCSILLSLWLTSGFITAAVHVLDVFAVGVGLEDVLGLLLLLLLHVVHAGGRTLHPLCTLVVRSMKTIMKLKFRLMTMTMMTYRFDPAYDDEGDDDNNDNDNDDDEDGDDDDGEVPV